MPFVLAAVLALTGWHRAQAQSPCVGVTYVECFRQLDRNGDGQISRQEANSPRFPEIDTNGDGFVTMEEWQAYLIREAIRQLDTDGDGKVSNREFQKLYCDAGRYYEERRRGAQPPAGTPLPAFPPRVRQRDPVQRAGLPDRDRGVPVPETR